MRYIKRFEDKTKNFGRYIQFDTKYSISTPEFGKIIEDDMSIPSPFYVETEFGHTWTGPNEIIRELTPEEIDEFETKLQAKKYNL